MESSQSPPAIANLLSRRVSIGYARITGIAVLFVLSRLGAAQETIKFNRDVRPILADRCFECHGPNEPDRQAELRLDQAQGSQGAHRTRDGSAVLKPGSIDESELWYRVTTADEGDAMPPPDSSKKPLTADERDIIRRWILQGGAYEKHWAFVTPVRPPAPEVEDERWSRQPIDRFVLRKLEAMPTKLKTKPGKRADRRSLIRRLSFDLTGLPPTLDEISRFLADRSSGAYERLVDRLLASPRYGEHMTKYWLDLVRFADTNGLHHDHFRDLTPYRDWVIRSFNENLPYDEFVTHQIAGDLYAEPSNDQLTASGFNRLHLIIDRGTALPLESFTRNVIDRVTAVGTAFMGLTVQCAVCHDHKYDPVKQRDFFQLFAFFNNLDAAPETGGRSGSDFRRGLQLPYVDFPNEEQAAALEKLDRARAETAARIKESKAASGRAAKGDGKKEPSKELSALQARQKKLNSERAAILIKVSAAMVMKEKAEPRPAHVLIRGEYDQPGEAVKRDTPGFLPPLKKKGNLATRMDLAEWLVSAEQPLTARVAVNRFWQQLFGVGIVKTAEDFGTRGDWPSHPELLDHLTVSFIESGWDVKALVRQIVMSATYQLSSAAKPAAFKRDPENRWLARGSRFRMDSEMIRDQILATSGRLNPTMFGKSVKPPQPPGIWKAVSLPDSYPKIFAADAGEAIYRRSVYTFWKRGMPPPQMSMLNAPSRESCIARRERTNTPLQALLLMNEKEYLEAARRLASIALDRNEESATKRLSFIYETITSRIPDAAEAKVLLRAVRDLESSYRGDPKLAEQLCGKRDPGARPAPELAAWTLLVNTIYNLDITKTRE